MSCCLERWTNKRDLGPSGAGLWLLMMNHSVRCVCQKVCFHIHGQSFVSEMNVLLRMKIVQHNALHYCSISTITWYWTGLCRCVLNLLTFSLPLEKTRPAVSTESGTMATFSAWSTFVFSQTKWGFHWDNIKALPVCEIKSFTQDLKENRGRRDFGRANFSSHLPIAAGSWYRMSCYVCAAPAGFCCFGELLPWFWPKFSCFLSLATGFFLFIFFCICSHFSQPGVVCLVLGILLQRSAQCFYSAYDK